MKIARNIYELIGNTPLIKLNWLSKITSAQIFAKLEFFNPFFSIKDRVALAMIREAEKKGLINKDTTIIEATSGNTGIALAGVAALKGYKVIIVAPYDISLERKRLLKALGAKLVFSKNGMQEAVEKAYALRKKIPNSFIPDQFTNPENPKIHKKTTALEIWQATEGRLDVIISGVGTGGTITGIAQFFKKKKKDIKIVAVEPKNSAVLSGKRPGKHKILGIGAGFIPPLLKKELIDEIVTVSDYQAIKMMKEIVRHEGILCGISSGAVAFAAWKIKEKYKKKKIVLIFADSLERCLSFYGG